MNAGRVEQDGTPEELYFHPANRFVAEFVGETNLISGQVHGQVGDDVVIDWHGAMLRGKARSAGTLASGPVTASIRLERLNIHDEKPESINAVQGKVTAKTFLGSRMMVDLVVEQAAGATLRAYVDTAVGHAMGRRADLGRLGCRQHGRSKRLGSAKPTTAPARCASTRCVRARPPYCQGKFGVRIGRGFGVAGGYRHSAPRTALKACIPQRQIGRPWGLRPAWQCSQAETDWPTTCKYLGLAQGRMRTSLRITCGPQGPVMRMGARR